MATGSRGRDGASSRGRKTRRDPADATRQTRRPPSAQQPDRTTRPTAPKGGTGSAPAEEWPPRVANYADDGETVLDSGGVSPDDLGDLYPAVQNVEPHTGEQALDDLPDPWNDQSPTELPMAIDTEVAPSPMLEEPTAVATEVAPGPMIGAPTVADPLIEPLPDSAMIKGSIETRSNDGHPSDRSPHERPVSIDENILSVEESTLPDVNLTHVVQPIAKQTSRTKVLLLAAVAVVVLLGTFLVAGVMLSKRAASPAAAGNAGSILVRTEPAAACTVFINGRPTELLAPGNSMLLGDLPAKAYDISVRCVGYQPFERQETVKPDEVTLINATLIREPSESNQTP